MCNRTRVAGKEHVESLKKSNFEYLADSENALFELLTEAPDPMERWTSEVFTHDEITNGNYSSATSDRKAASVNGQGPSCTLAYMSQCMTLNKCKTSCASMGATSYRWFYDGCCECVGENCPPFGIDVAKCQQCPLHAVDDFAEEEPTYVEQKDQQEQDDENRFSQANSDDQPNESDE